MLDRITVSVLATATALLAIPAHAQSATSADPAATAANTQAPDTSEEIVVTATFRRQNLQNAPLAITAISSATMEARGQVSVLDIAATAPNVTIKESAGPFGNSAAVAIRGVGQYDTNFALEPGVGVYIDDVYYPSLYGNVLDLLDVDRAEILRGPQGTLAGKNSIGGAIKLYSRLPGGGTDGYIQGTYGSRNRIDFRAGGNVTLVPDALFLRVTGALKRQDGYVTRKDYGCAFPSSGVPRTNISTDCVLGKLGGTDFKGARAALRWLAAPGLTVDLAADYSSDDSQPTAQRLIFGSTAARRMFLPEDRFTSYATFSDPGRNFVPPIENSVKGWGVSGNVSWRLSKLFTLTSITAYRGYNGAFTTDLDVSPAAINTQYYKVRYHWFTQELRLNGSLFDGALDFTLGGYIFDGQARQGGRVDIPPAFDFLLNDPVDSKSKSAFAQSVVHVTSGLNVSAGVRYTDESKDYTFVRKPANGIGTVPLVGSLDGLTSHYRGNHVDYRVSIDYRWTPGLLTYATVSTGFKGGGVNPRPFIPNQAIPFNPEKLTAYEVGIKSDLFDRRVRLNVSAFRNDYTDILLTIANGFTGADGVFFPISAIPINAGKARVSGVEGEATLRPIDGLLIDASFGYLHFKYDTLSAAAQASGVRFGMVAPYAPKWQGTVGVQYAIPAGGGGTVTPRVDMNFQSSFYTSAANAATNLNPKYTVFNGRITWQPADSPWEASVSVSNIGDKYYYTNTFDNTNSTGTVVATVARPREFAVSLKRKF